MKARYYRLLRDLHLFLGLFSSPFVRVFALSMFFSGPPLAVRHGVVNLWGVMKVHHAFTGVQMDDARQGRDWALTSVWAYSMDGIPAGLIFMVRSSLYRWWELPQKRLLGAGVLGLGSRIYGRFCVGLRWLF